MLENSPLWLLVSVYQPSRYCHSSSSAISFNTRSESLFLWHSTVCAIPKSFNTLYLLWIPHFFSWLGNVCNISCDMLEVKQQHILELINSVLKVQPYFITAVLISQQWSLPYFTMILDKSDRHKKAPIETVGSFSSHSRLFWVLLFSCLSVSSMLVSTY